MASLRVAPSCSSSFAASSSSLFAPASCVTLLAKNEIKLVAFFVYLVFASSRLFLLCRETTRTHTQKVTTGLVAVCFTLHVCLVLSLSCLH